MSPDIENECVRKACEEAQKKEIRKWVSYGEDIKDVIKRQGLYISFSSHHVVQDKYKQLRVYLNKQCDRGALVKKTFKGSIALYVFPDDKLKSMADDILKEKNK